MRSSHSVVNAWRRKPGEDARQRKKRTDGSNRSRRTLCWPSGKEIIAPVQSLCYPSSNLIDPMDTLVCLSFARVFRPSALAFVSVCWAFATAAICESARPAASASTSYASEALMVERTEITYKYNDDGTGCRAALKSRILSRRSASRASQILH
jgi:hypothetical protein